MPFFYLFSPFPGILYPAMGSFNTLQIVTGIIAE
jgi:hypothetical protein